MSKLRTPLACAYDFRRYQQRVLLPVSYTQGQDTNTLVSNTLRGEQWVSLLQRPRFLSHSYVHCILGKRRISPPSKGRLLHVAVKEGSKRVFDSVQPTRGRAKAWVWVFGFPSLRFVKQACGLAVCKPLCFSNCILQRHGTRNVGSVSCLNIPLAMSNFHRTILCLMYE